MAKKAHKIRKKKSSAEKKIHPPSWRVLLVRYFVNVIGIWAIAALGIVFFSKSPIPCANSISCAKNLTAQVDNTARGTFLGKVVIPPKINLADEVTNQPVLGTTQGVKKIIYVDLSKQLLYAYEGDNLVYTFPVSTGKWYPTPTGTFHIWIKLRATRMAGGNPAIGTFYDLPNVPYTMFFANDEVDRSRGFSLHGAYWHNNFGHTMSHGCVNMRIEDAKKLYNWAEPPTTGYTTYATADAPGTQVIIYGQPPLE